MNPLDIIPFNNSYSFVSWLLCQARRSGALDARLAGDQSSGVLLSMVRADGLAIVEAGTTQLPAGSEVRVQLLGRDDLQAEPGF